MHIQLALALQIIVVQLLKIQMQTLSCHGKYASAVSGHKLDIIKHLQMYLGKPRSVPNAV
jgi:hypothetical protein